MWLLLTYAEGGKCVLNGSKILFAFTEEGKTVLAMDADGAFIRVKETPEEIYAMLTVA